VAEPLGAPDLRLIRPSPIVHSGQAFVLSNPGVSQRLQCESLTWFGVRHRPNDLNIVATIRPGYYAHCYLAELRSSADHAFCVEPSRSVQGVWQFGVLGSGLAPSFDPGGR
jgi:hypothetical protein